MPYRGGDPKIKKIKPDLWHNPLTNTISQLIIIFYDAKLILLDAYSKLFHDGLLNQFVVLTNQNTPYGDLH